LRRARCVSERKGFLGVLGVSDEILELFLNLDISLETEFFDELKIEKKRKHEILGNLGKVQQIIKYEKRHF